MMHSIASSQPQQQPLENGVGKTPARSVNRRALGDISNRKAPLQYNENMMSKTPLMMKKTEPTKSISTSVQPEIRRKVPLQVPSNELPQHSSSLRSTTATTGTTKRNTAATTTTNTVTFILPDDTKALQVPSQPQTHHRSTITTVPPTDTTKHSSSFWTYHDDESDIELPAGRLYQEQLRLYENHDDDNESQLSLEGAHTFRDDYVTLFMEGHDKEMQDKDTYMLYCTQQMEQNCIITDDGTYVLWYLFPGTKTTFLYFDWTHCVTSFRLKLIFFVYTHTNNFQIRSTMTIAHSINHLRTTMTVLPKRFGTLMIQPMRLIIFLVPMRNGIVPNTRTLIFHQY